MKKLKNNKFKNTGFIFDVLIRNVTTEILNNQKQSTLDIIKKFFKVGTELAKEVQIYKMLSENVQNANSAKELVTIAKKMHSGIDQQKLNTEKYKIIGELKKHFDLKTFFETRVLKYAEYATIYKYLNYNAVDNPADYLNAKNQIVEQISTGYQSADLKNTSEILLENTSTNEDRKLILRTIINLFNTKYADLNKPQKKLLAKYINENTTDNTFLKYCQLEACKIKTILQTVKTDIKNPVLKIKLNEISNLTTKIETSNRITDEHVSSLLKYYELIYLLGGK